MFPHFDPFKLRAEAVSAEVHRFARKPEAVQFIGEVVRAEGAAVWANDSLLDAEEQGRLAGQIPGLAFEVTREGAEAARVGITEAGWGIANTGTLVMDAAPVARRLASTLPPIHVAIVPTGAIQPDMAAALARISPQRCGYISMITGPSRTADIERVLTIGVHGPSRLIIIAVDDLRSDS